MSKTRKKEVNKLVDSYLKKKGVDMQYSKAEKKDLVLNFVREDKVNELGKVKQKVNEKEQIKEQKGKGPTTPQTKRANENKDLKNAKKKENKSKALGKEKQEKNNKKAKYKERGEEEKEKQKEEKSEEKGKEKEKEKEKTKETFMDSTQPNSKKIHRRKRLQKRNNTFPFSSARNLEKEKEKRKKKVKTDRTKRKARRAQTFSASEKSSDSSTVSDKVSKKDSKKDGKKSGDDRSVVSDKVSKKDSKKSGDDSSVVSDKASKKDGKKDGKKNGADDASFDAIVEDKLDTKKKKGKRLRSHTFGGDAKSGDRRAFASGKVSKNGTRGPAFATFGGRLEKKKKNKKATRNFSQGYRSENDKDSLLRTAVNRSMMTFRSKSTDFGKASSVSSSTDPEKDLKGIEPEKCESQVPEKSSHIGKRTPKHRRKLRANGKSPKEKKKRSGKSTIVKGKKTPKQKRKHKTNVKRSNDGKGKPKKEDMKKLEEDSKIERTKKRQTEETKQEIEAQGKKRKKTESEQETLNEEATTMELEQKKAKVPQELKKKKKKKRETEVSELQKKHDCEVNKEQFDTLKDQVTKLGKFIERPQAVIEEPKHHEKAIKSPQHEKGRMTKQDEVLGCGVVQHNCEVPREEFDILTGQVAQLTKMAQTILQSLAQEKLEGPKEQQRQKTPISKNSEKIGKEEDKKERLQTWENDRTRQVKKAKSADSLDEADFEEGKDWRSVSLIGRLLKGTKRMLSPPSSSRSELAKQAPVLGSAEFLKEKGREKEVLELGESQDLNVESSYVNDESDFKGSTQSSVKKRSDSKRESTGEFESSSGSYTFVTVTNSEFTEETTTDSSSGVGSSRSFIETSSGNDVLLSKFDSDSSDDSSDSSTACSGKPLKRYHPVARAPHLVRQPDSTYDLLQAYEKERKHLLRKQEKLKRKEREAQRKLERKREKERMMREEGEMSQEEQKEEEKEEKEEERVSLYNNFMYKFDTFPLAKKRPKPKDESLEGDLKDGLVDEDSGEKKNSDGLVREERKKKGTLKEKKSQKEKRTTETESEDSVVVVEEKNCEPMREARKKKGTSKEKKSEKVKRTTETDREVDERTEDEDPTRRFRKKNHKSEELVEIQRDSSEGSQIAKPDVVSKTLKVPYCEKEPDCEGPLHLEVKVEKAIVCGALGLKQKEKIEEFGKAVGSEAFFVRGSVVEMEEKSEGEDPTREGSFRSKDKAEEIPTKGESLKKELTRRMNLKFPSENLLVLPPSENVLCASQPLDTSESSGNDSGKELGPKGSCIISMKKFRNDKVKGLFLRKSIQGTTAECCTEPLDQPNITDAYKTQDQNKDSENFASDGYKNDNSNPNSNPNSNNKQSGKKEMYQRKKNNQHNAWGSGLQIRKMKDTMKWGVLEPKLNLHADMNSVAHDKLKYQIASQKIEINILRSKLANDEKIFKCSTKLYSELETITNTARDLLETLNQNTASFDKNTQQKIRNLEKLVTDKETPMESYDLSTNNNRNYNNHNVHNISADGDSDCEVVEVKQHLHLKAKNRSQPNSPKRRRNTCPFGTKVSTQNNKPIEAIANSGKVVRNKDNKASACVSSPHNTTNTNTNNKTTTAANNRIQTINSKDNKKSLCNSSPVIATRVYKNTKTHDEDKENNSRHHEHHHNFNREIEEQGYLIAKRVRSLAARTKKKNVSKTRFASIDSSFLRHPKLLATRTTKSFSRSSPSLPLRSS